MKNWKALSKFSLKSGKYAILLLIVFPFQFGFTCGEAQGFVILVVFC